MAFCDPYFADVGLLVFMNGANGSGTFTDASPNSLTVTTSGAVTNSSAQTLNGANTGAFPGIGAQLQVPATASGPLDILTAAVNFTIEGWAYLTSLTPPGSGTISVLVSYFNPSSDSNYVRIYVATNGAATMQIAGNYSGTPVTSPGTVSAGQWLHFAGVRYGSTFTIYINGVAGGTTYSNAGAIGFGTTSNVTLGGDSLSGAQDTGLGGYLSNVRITVGLARYTSNFTPPTAPLPGTACSVGVPSVVGQTLATATANNKAAGFVTTVQELNHPTIATGLVISQNPAAGTVLPLGSNIIIQLSTGPTTTAGMGGDVWGSTGGGQISAQSQEPVGQALAYATQQINALNAAPTQSVAAAMSLGVVTQATPNTSVPTTPAVG